MALTPSQNSHSRFYTLAAMLLLVVTLRYARDIILPFTLGILLSFLLSPLVDRVERWKIPRIPAVLIVALWSFMFIFVIGYIMGMQLVDLGEKLPQYRQNIHTKVDALGRGGHLSKMTAGFRDVGQEFGRLATGLTTTATLPTTASLATRAAAHRKDRGPTVVALDPEAVKPIKVEIADSPSSSIAMLSATLGPLFQPLGMAAVIFILTIFILIYREDLRDRLIRLIGEGRLNVTTQALDDAAQRVSKYLSMQLIVNACYGIPIGIGLYFIGMPNAMLWGALATILRFIPYIGAWIAASMPLILSLAVFDSWVPFAETVGLFIVIELVCSNVIEPWLYSAHTGVSQVALIVSAMFWTWLWGPIGLMLATPVSVCLVVLGRYVPQLEFFTILLGDQPVLALEVRVYQRLLALHVDDARRLLEEQITKTSVEEVYDTTMLPILGLSERDRQRGALSHEVHSTMLSALREIIIDFGESRLHVSDPALGREENGRKGTVSIPAQPPVVGALPADYAVLCIPAREEVDEIAALMLYQLLMSRGIQAVLVSSKALASEMLELAGEHNIRMTCVSALPPFADLHARYICKRLHARHPKLPMIIGLWNPNDDPRLAAERLGTCDAEAVVVSYTAALAQIPQILAPIVASENAAGALVRDITSTAAPRPSITPA